MKVEGQILKGHLDTLLLAALDGAPRHGYAVIEALRDNSDGRFDLPTGTVYPALHRLQDAKLLTSSWSVVDGRRRRVYELTPAGRDKLHTERAGWREFAATVTAMLEPPPCPAT